MTLRRQQNYLPMVLAGKSRELAFKADFCQYFKISPMEVDHSRLASMDERNGIDLKIKGFTYDVKGRTKLSRTDLEFSSEFVWLELKSVSGRAGSAIRGADFNVYEREDSWLVVKKTKLVVFIFDWVDFTTFGTKESGFLYKLKTRQGRSDLLTLARIHDLQEIGEYSVPKFTKK